jgi:NADH dehydrogenase
VGKPRVVILGAGFAGVGVFQELRRHLTAVECEVVVVDQNNFSLYTPMLAEAAGGAVDASDIVAPVRSLARDITFEQGHIDHIDVAGKHVTITIGGERFGIPDLQRDISYDYLVIALGSVTNYHHIGGLEEHSIPAKTIEDAIEIRNRALALLERADEETDPGLRQEFVTFVVGGGGFSGVETMAALNDMVREIAPHCPHVLRHEIRTILVHPGDRLLPEIGARLAAYTHSELEKRGVEVMLDTSVDAAGPGWVEIKGARDGESRRIACRTLIWTGGVMPSPVVETAGLRRGRHGGIEVDSTCAVPGHDGIWALGDCAEVPVPGQHSTYAPTAQNAIREGKRVGQNIVAVMNGRQPEPFVYSPVGELAIVGKRAGVASVYGLQFKGIIAWAMWRGIYVAKLPRFSMRFRVVLDWGLEAIFGRDIAQLPGARHTRRTPAQKRR